MTCEWPTALILLAVAGTTQASAQQPSQQDSTAAVVAWAREHAIPLTTVEPGRGFEDLRALRRIIGAARVVSFGEGTHNAHELLALRNRMFEYLVEELGFTAIALETGYAQAIAVDDYVLGRRGAAPDLERGAFSWVDVSFAENQQLIEWIRAYNSRPTTRRKIRFYGIEMSGRFRDRTDARGSVDAALAYVDTVEADQARQFRRVLGLLLDRFNSNGYVALTAAERSALTAGIHDLVSLFERRQVVWLSRSSELAYHRAHRHAVVARQLDTSFRVQATPWSARPGDNRDAAAAANLRWVLEREGPEGRVFVFSHNMHVKKGRRFDADQESIYTSMGEYLREWLGDEMVVIGSAYDRGETRDWLGLFGFTNELTPVPPSDPASLNGVLADVGLPLYVVDLRTLPREGMAMAWLNRRRPLRNLNVVAEYNHIIPVESFDALIFVETISPLHPLPSPLGARGCTLYPSRVRLRSSRIACGDIQAARREDPRSALGHG